MSELNAPNNQDTPNLNEQPNQPQQNVQSEPTQQYNQTQQQYSNQSQYNNQSRFNNLNDFERPPKPNNSLILAIVGAVLGTCTSCIGIVTGIIAVVYALQVDSKYAIGDYDGAESAAKTAKTLAIVTLVIDAIAIIAGIIYFVIVGAAALTQY